MQSVEIHSNEKGSAVIALKDFKKGDVVLKSTPFQIVDAPEKYTIQKTATDHILLKQVEATNVNHSCNPNLYIVDNDEGAFDFVALRDISAGEELSWDYETTEMQLSNPFKCLCQSENCRGWIRGFAYLDQKHFPSSKNQVSKFIQAQWSLLGSRLVEFAE